MRKRNDAVWMERLDACKKYASDHDGCVPPQKLIVDGFALGLWFRAQTFELRHGDMPIDRREALEDFLAKTHGPKFGAKRNDGLWMERFGAYKEYVMEHLSFPTTSSEFGGVKVGEWFYNQVAAFQGGQLPIERLALLDSVHPAWKMPSEARRNAETDLVTMYDWHHRIPYGDVGLDRALSGTDLQACLVEGIFGCRQYLERFSALRNGNACVFWDSNEGCHVIKRFGAGVFSLENRGIVFEKLFPKTSFLGFNLICGASGIGDNGTYVQEAELYNQNSPFKSPEEMLSVVHRMMFYLPDFASNVLCERFEEGLTFVEIASKMGVSRTRVQQIEQKGLLRLRKCSEWNMLAPQKGIDEKLDNALRRSELTRGMIPSKTQNLGI